MYIKTIWISNGPHKVWTSSNALNENKIFKDNHLESLMHINTVSLETSTQTSMIVYYLLHKCYLCHHHAKKCSNHSWTHTDRVLKRRKSQLPLWWCRQTVSLSSHFLHLIILANIKRCETLKNLRLFKKNTSRCKCPVQWSISATMWSAWLDELEGFLTHTTRS